jgi:adenine-specific DNA-methyltransferase
MAKSNRKPSFVNYLKGEEEILVGEFHYGSASNPKVLEPGKGVKLFLTDPPYNLGFDYGPEVNDKQPEDEYHQMMEDVFDSCYEAADDDANLFIIHYPQDLAKMWPRLTKKWKFHQWITWAYPANFGHSTKKWTNASRTILWLTKGYPEFYGDRVVQPYKNPTDSRIKKLIHEEGKIGTSLYNWWEVNLCKNVSKDKKNYSNQIPEDLLERIILSTTNKGDLVADPFSGTFSTSRTAMRLGRRAWGCDLNPEVIQWRPTIIDYKPRARIPKQQYDKKYPNYKIQEAGITEDQFLKIAVYLLENISAEELSKAPGIGIKKAREFKRNLNGNRDDNSSPSIFEYED